MTGSARTVLAVKYRIIDNFVREIRSHLWIHVAAGLVTLVIIITGGGGFFWWIFTFLRRQEPFGAPLMELLIPMVLLAFFSMLVFSNLIITLTTTYISKETEFLMGFPIRHSGVFVVKLVESIFYSSWAFALLSVPLFTAYGLSKSAPLYFYPVAFVAGLPFMVIPACLGAMVTMLLSAYFPARKARLFSFGLLAASLGITALIVKLMGLRSMVVSAGVNEFSQIMAFLNKGSLPLLPNFWLARAIRSASERQLFECGYWFLCMLSTAMMCFQLCVWMAPRLYYRGWSLAKESSSPTQTTGGRSLFPFFDRLFRIFSPPVRALLSKDVRTFWRDPAQWSQVIILMGLLVIYVANIRGLTKQMQGIEAFFKHWRTVLSFFNIGATCFVLSIMTTRFIYPMLSLEGKQYWVVGLAPFAKQKLVWEKYSLCLLASASVALPLILFSNTMLSVRPLLAWIGLAAILVMTFGLTGLAVGLGAMFPNFKEDNPARIANGMGGTVNILFSLFYITANLGLLVPLALIATGAVDNEAIADMGLRGQLRHILYYGAPYFLGLTVLNVLCIYLPMRIGLRRWLNLEFHL